MASPRGAVAGHEEGYRCVSDLAVVQLGFVAEVVHYIDDAALVDGADVSCDVDVDGQAEEEERESEV